jgi:hypothetical protein
MRRRAAAAVAHGRHCYRVLLQPAQGALALGLPARHGHCRHLLLPVRLTCPRGKRLRCDSGTTRIRPADCWHRGEWLLRTAAAAGGGGGVVLGVARAEGGKVAGDGGPSSLISITGPVNDKGKHVFQPPTLRERLLFAVDDFLSTTHFPRLAILGGSTGLLLAVASGAYYYTGGVPMSRKEALWTAWTTIADPGTHTLLPAGQGRMRGLGVTFTLGGLFFFALLIGLVNDSISS